MKLRSFLGFALIALGTIALFTPISTLQDVGAAALRLVETAADNPLSFNALVMTVITLAVLVIVALLILGTLERRRVPVTVSGERLRRGEPVYLDIDGVYRRMPGI